MIKANFIVILVLLQWSETKLTISPKNACIWSDAGDRDKHLYPQTTLMIFIAHLCVLLIFRLQVLLKTVIKRKQESDLGRLGFVCASQTSC